MITNATVPVGLLARIVRPTSMTVKTVLVLMEECVLMEFKAILVFVKLALLEKTAKLPSMIASLLLVLMELAQICLMITNVRVVQDILVEIVQY